MPVIDHIDLRKIICEIFERSGAPSDEAKIVSDHLVEANLSGHDSHEVIRAVSYAEDMKGGVVSSSKYEIARGKFGNGGDKCQRRFRYCCHAQSNGDGY